MLFLKDDLRIASATFAIVDPVDVDHPSAQLDLLSDIRAVVAYAYSSPHEVFDDILLTPEEASLVVMSPGEVSKFLVYPDHHVVPLEGSIKRRVAADDRAWWKDMRAYITSPNPCGSPSARASTRTGRKLRSIFSRTWLGISPARSAGAPVPANFSAC
ncbi:MAG: hypothetical protein ACK4Z8_12280 [Novosphingobium sp.]